MLDNFFPVFKENTTVDVRLVNVTTGKIEMAFKEYCSASQSDVVT